MRDIKDAVRQLRHRPALAATVVLMLALGIGANALVFSAVRAVLLRPLPFPEPQRLVAVWETQPGVRTRSVAPANFLDWRSAASFDGLASYDGRRRTLGGEDPQRIETATVSANFFGVLGVNPVVGRMYAAAVAPGMTRQVVIREDFWHQRFGGDRAVVGRTLRLDEETLVIAGVVPTKLAFPEGVVAWTQAPHDIPELGGISRDLRGMRDAWYFQVIGRLRAGVGVDQAQAELDAIAARLRDAFPATNRNSGVNVVDLHAQVTGSSASTLWVLSGVVACVLVVACGNVATLLLAAALGRRRELMIRAALGASRARLVAQLTTESLLLAICGGGLGVVLAYGGRPAMLALLPADLPRASAIVVDAGVVWFALGLGAITAVLFGAAPSVVAARLSTFTTLRDGGRSGGSRAGNRLASVLVVAQLAAVLVLVTGTGLMLRTLHSLYQRDLGIDAERLLAADVTIPDARSRGRAAAAADIQHMVDRLRVLPGVTAAAAVGTLPLAARGPSANIRVDGRSFPPNEAPDVVWKAVTPDYFRAVGSRVVRGRVFRDEDRDGAQPVAVINVRLAQLLWTDRDPIGARIGTGLDGDGAPVLIVGIVGDTPQEGIGGEVLPEMYRPLAQPARFGVESMSLLVRTEGEPLGLTAAVRQALREARPQAPVAAVRPLTDVVEAGLAREYTAARALAMFGGLALVLAVIGLYGVMARLVGDRTRELGVRLALGADPRTVRRLVLGRTVRLAACGLLAGTFASLLLSRQLESFLHGVSAADPLAFGVAAAVLFAAALGASYLPARRASQVDPLIVLKEE